MEILKHLFQEQKRDSVAVKNNIAKLLNMDPEAFRAFEEAYQKQALDDRYISENLFEVSAKQAAGQRERAQIEDALNDLVDRIVNELLAQTPIYEYDGKQVKAQRYQIPEEHQARVTLDDINRFPQELRPQLSGDLMKKDITEPAYIILLEQYQEFLRRPNSKEGKRNYNMFRQGLDILDLDPITYQIIGMNPNSIGVWLPPLVNAVIKQSFFKVPATTVIWNMAGKTHCVSCGMKGRSVDSVSLHISGLPFRQSDALCVVKIWNMFSQISVRRWQNAYCH